MEIGLQPLGPARLFLSPAPIPEGSFASRLTPGNLLPSLSKPSAINTCAKPLANPFRMNTYTSASK